MAKALSARVAARFTSSGSLEKKLGGSASPVRGLFAQIILRVWPWVAAARLAKSNDCLS